MFFATAGIEIAPWIPPLVSFVISFATSMGGISGAFLLLPFQMSFLGYTNPSVSATNQVFNIVAIPSGVWRYWREGRMVWPLTWIVVAGSLPGVFAGALIRVRYLPDPKKFKLVAGAMLLYIGMKLILDLLGKKSSGQDKASAEKRFQELVRKHRGQALSFANEIQSAQPVAVVTRFDWKYLAYTFYGEQFCVPFLGVFTLSLVVGIAGGIYGIGGGAIIAPFLMTFFRLPVYTIAGASLMATFVTSVAGVFFYQALAPFYPHLSVAPDWLLGLLFGMGGMAGMYLGARCQKFISAKILKWMLASVIVYTAARYLFSFFA